MNLLHRSINLLVRSFQDVVRKALSSVYCEQAQ